MNGRKARGRRKALRRSRESTASRFARKAAGAEMSEREIEAQKKIAKARSERDALLASANEAFRKGAKELEKNRADARASAWDDYEKQRNQILKDFAAAGERAA